MPGNGLDVTRAGDAAAATALAEQEFGGLDVLVNNGGHGMVGAIEEGSPQEYRPLFETNVFGVIETTRAALPALRKAGGGRIVMVSSGAGIAGSAGSGYHNATKFAVEGLSEALAQEVAPFGIATIIVEPGPFRTEFLGRSMRMAAAEMPEYAGTAGAAATTAPSTTGGSRVTRARRSTSSSARSTPSTRPCTSLSAQGLRPRQEEVRGLPPGDGRMGAARLPDRLRRGVNRARRSPAGQLSSRPSVSGLSRVVIMPTTTSTTVRQEGGGRLGSPRVVRSLASPVRGARRIRELHPRCLRLRLGSVSANKGYAAHREPNSNL